MWTELLPKMVGGTLADDDAPNEPTEITGFTITDDYVTIVGRDFSFGGSRQFFGVSVIEPGRLAIHGYGMGAIVEMPAASERQP